MGRAQAERVGRGTCPHCGSAVTFRRSSGGMLKYKCDDCQATGYAEPGGKAYKQMHDSIKFDQPDTNPKDSGPPIPDAPAPAPTPAKKVNSIFNLGAL